MFQAIVILICVLANTVEGYDILVMAFVVPAVSKAWSLSGSRLGILFSASLFGIAIGSLVLSSIFSCAVGRTLCNRRHPDRRQTAPRQ